MDSICSSTFGDCNDGVDVEVCGRPLQGVKLSHTLSETRLPYLLHTLFHSFSRLAMLQGGIRPSLNKCGPHPSGQSKMVGWHSEKDPFLTILEPFPCQYLSPSAMAHTPIFGDEYSGSPITRGQI